jgi:hypothetical protein
MVVSLFSDKVCTFRRLPNEKGDVAVQRGTNHKWVIGEGKMAKVIFCLVDGGTCATCQTAANMCTAEFTIPGSGKVVKDEIFQPI